MDKTQDYKVAIVTGAGSGVGRETAMLLGEAGYAVTLVGRTEATLREAAAYVRRRAGAEAPVLVWPADVRDSAACAEVVERTVEAFGRVDALANCAGSAPLQPIDRLTDEIIDDALAVNLKSVIYLTRAVWPVFRKQASGAICNVSSMSSLDPFEGFNVYGAAKAGVNLFTRATADEGKRFNVTAAAVAPGAIETPMLRQNFGIEVLPRDRALAPLAVAEAIRDILTGRRATGHGETVVLRSP